MEHIDWMSIGIAGVIGVLANLVTPSIRRFILNFAVGVGSRFNAGNVKMMEARLAQIKEQKEVIDGFLSNTTKYTSFITSHLCSQAIYIWFLIIYRFVADVYVQSNPDASLFLDVFYASMIGLGIRQFIKLLFLLSIVNNVSNSKEYFKELEKSKGKIINILSKKDTLG